MDRGRPCNRPSPIRISYDTRIDTDTDMDTGFLDLDTQNAQSVQPSISPQMTDDLTEEPEISSTTGDPVS